MMKLTMASARVLRAVIDQGLSLERAVTEVENSFDGNLSELKEVAFGGCRFYTYLDILIAELLQKPLKERDRIVHFLLVSALYQIEFMRAPDHAVVNESVNALEHTRQSWAKSLTNGLLRNFIRKKADIIQSINQHPSKYEHVIHKQVIRAFPQHLYARIKHDWPKDYPAIIGASNEKPPLTLRINQRLTNRLEVEAEFQKNGMEYTLVADNTLGIILNQPIAVHKIPRFAQGWLSVQDESAQIIASAMALSSGQRVLDGCAAPGGKSCLILESQPDLATLVAIDLPHRIATINQNLTRLKLNRLTADTTVIAADLPHTAAWWDGRQFDRILLDAPCSGSGIIRRHPDIKHRRRETDIEKFATQQLSMINALWALLKPGGKILYVTCSIFRAENDAVIEKFIQHRTDCELQFLDQTFGRASAFGRQRLPGIHSGDGFYYCAINKSRQL